MTEVPYKILLIEDEVPIRKVLRITLDAQGYKLIEADTFKLGLIEAAQCQPDVILLDLGLPDGDGVDLTRQIREFLSVPIIVISARGQEQDKINALDAGADDYLTKPFSVGELLARLRVALRRTAQVKSDAQTSHYDHMGLQVNFAARSVFLNERPLHLTPNEYRLLAVLIRNEGRVLTHEYLLREVWGLRGSSESHYVRVYINQLREKLLENRAKPRFIHTESGVGYRFGDPEPL